MAPLPASIRPLPELRRFNPLQPRRPDGKWGSGVPAEKNVLLNLGTPDEAEMQPKTLRSAAVNKFARRAALVVPGIVGGGKSRFTGKIKVMPVEGNYSVLASMGWDGTMNLREDVARKLSDDLSGTGPVSDPDDFQVILHELVHSLGGGVGSDDSIAYGSSPKYAGIEEGFTELTATNHLADFTRKMGVGDRPTPVIAVENGKVVEDQAGNSAHATVAQFAQRLADPARISTGTSWGHYRDMTQAAQSWCQDVANAEGDRSGQAGTPAALDAMNARVVQLADEIGRVGTREKPAVMASQVLRALGIPDTPQTNMQLQQQVLKNFGAGSSGWSGAAMTLNSGFSAVAAAAKGGTGSAADASRAAGEADPRMGVRVPEVPRAGGSAAGQRAGGQGYGPGAARRAGRGRDAVPAGGMTVRPLPPAPPELRYSPLQPRGPHGKWIKGLESELARVEHKPRPAPPAHAAPSPARPPAGVASKAVTPPDFHGYSSSFTPEQEQAAQLATRRALLAYSQKKILDALNTPPENMTPEQIETATRVLAQLSGAQISQSVDTLRQGGVPDPVVNHVKTKLGELQQDMAKEKNADAKQKLVTHVAAIAAAVGLSLGSMGLAIPAAIAAIIAAFPALSQEFIDFKSDFTTKRQAAKAAKAASLTAGPATAPPPAARSLELRTALTPVLSTVHHPFGNPAGPGLFHVQGLQLPAYIQNVAHAFTRTGTPESEAIARAIGVVRDWAEGRTPDGKGKVHPDVRAAAIKAIAEWDAARAAAHASSK